MKKIAKLSLVAAIAVAGLTTANAQPLEEAIKNVDVSGSVVYRYNDYKNNTVKSTVTAPGADTNTNNYKVGLNLSSKVNEDVKFNSRFLVASTQGDFAGPLDYTSAGDTNPAATLSHAYFGYTGIKNTTVNVGKQGLATPWTVALDSDGNEQTGTGILALSTVGPVTVAGAYFNQTNLDLSGNVPGLNGRDAVATVGVIGVAGPATLDAWYLDMDQTFDSYTVGAKAAMDLSGINLGADARFASLTMDKEGSKAQTISKLVLTADAGLVDGKIAYAKTGKNGGITALDQDATTTLLGWSINALHTDADYWQAVLGFDILSNLNLSANYGNIQYITSATTDVEEEEIYAQLLYKMSKNLTTYVRYGTYTKDTTVSGVNSATNDDTRGRLQVEYTF